MLPCCLVLPKVEEKRETSPDVTFSGVHAGVLSPLSTFSFGGVDLAVTMSIRKTKNS